MESVILVADRLVPRLGMERAVLDLMAAGGTPITHLLVISGEATPGDALPQPIIELGIGPGGLAASEPFQEFEERFERSVGKRRRRRWSPRASGHSLR